MRNSKERTIILIVIIAIAAVAIIGGIFAYLFLATDVFKSEQQLFAKYLTQNIEELKNSTSLEKAEAIQKKLKENKYEENLTISYATSEDDESLAQITIDTQNDNINKKNYGILGLSLEGMEETLNVEYLRDNEDYSLRFTNGVNQFVTLQNYNLKQFAKKLGVDEETLEQIPNTIDFEKFSLEELNFTQEEINTETNRYANLLYNNISKEKYTKTKKAVITLNGETITTNSYTLTLNMQDIKNLGIKLLETLKQDEIVLAKLQIIDEKLQDYLEESLKDAFIESIQESIDELSSEEITEEGNIILTVYEQKGKTVRVKLEQELETLTLDTVVVEGKKKISLKYTSIDWEDVQTSTEIVFLKENDNKLNIQFINNNGEEQEISEMSLELIEEESNIKLNIIANNESGVITINRNIDFVDEINYKVTLNNSNNIILNELSQEKIKQVFNVIITQLNTEYLDKIEKVFNPNEESSTENTDTSTNQDMVEDTHETE